MITKQKKQHKMILDKEVEISVSHNMIKRYSDLGYDVINGKKLIVKIEHLTKKSHTKINVKCDICDNKKELDFSNYIVVTKNLTELYFCKKCSRQKAKKTNFEKYGNEIYNNREQAKKTCFKNFGVEHPFQHAKIKEKSKQTKIDRYGNENFTNRKQGKKTMLEKYGVEYSGQSEKLINKTNQTKLKKYGDENYNNKEQSKKTKLKLYGNENFNNREQAKKTMIIRHGVEHPSQSIKIFKKMQKSSFKIVQYKNTNIYTQGSFELYFVELMDKHGFINELTNGKSYNYILNKEQHVYHSDFIFKEKIIEIKSSWTYNKNGKDKELELENETKWQAVRDKGDDIVILFSKEEIKNYVENLK